MYVYYIYKVFDGMFVDCYDCKDHQIQGMVMIFWEFGLIREQMPDIHDVIIVFSEFPLIHRLIHIYCDFDYFIIDFY